MRIYVLHVGDFKEKYFADGEKEYIKRLSPFCEYKTIGIKEEKLPAGPSKASVEKALEAEAARINGRLPSDCVKVALCVEGKQLASVEFAGFLESSAQNGKAVCFIIGSSNGLDGEFKNRCDLRLSFSKLTFPHRLARLILAEQVYRANMILANKKYHK